ncbi:predicted protein [Histoplasma capsulatum H143]|uniref:Uncharacterized protein n=1 Tax=Ajellomyces capsulatus (strain H143) TaxID=544712 RepID=C6HCC5_AJECH|nr:predicted protein [Histoplasma capsulatum H143]
MQPPTGFGAFTLGQRPMASTPRIPAHCSPLQPTAARRQVGRPLLARRFLAQCDLLALISGDDDVNHKVHNELNDSLRPKNSWGARYRAYLTAMLKSSLQRRFKFFNLGSSTPLLLHSRSPVSRAHHRKFPCLMFSSITARHANEININAPRVSNYRVIRWLS